MSEELGKTARVTTKVFQRPWSECVVAGYEKLTELVVAGQKDAFINERAYRYICRIECSLAEIRVRHVYEDFTLIVCESEEQAFLFGIGAKAVNMLINRAEPLFQWCIAGRGSCAYDENKAYDVAVFVCEGGDAEEFFDWLRKHKEYSARHKGDAYCIFDKDEFEKLCKAVHAEHDNTHEGVWQRLLNMLKGGKR